MSKRDLKLYLKELKKRQLEEQILELYGKFKEVKTYYDFAFNPNEKKLLEESKFKISKEYFPINTRKPKLRRSVAQKYIAKFIQLGVEPTLISDVMLYNIEIAQAYSADHSIRSEAFYKSMLVSFEKAVKYMLSEGVFDNFIERLKGIVAEAENQNWFNKQAFYSVLKS